MVDSLAELEREGRIHPSLMSPEKWEEFLKEKNKRTRLKLIRQLKKIRDTLASFASSLPEKKRVPLCAAVESLGDCIFVLEELTP